MAQGAAARERAAATRLRSSRVRSLRIRDGRVHGWLFVAPALGAYGLFVLWPLVQTARYSLYRWDGVAPPEWVGLENFRTVFSDPQLVAVLKHAFQLILFFTGIPVILGLIVAAVTRRVATRRVATTARTVLFLPQVV